MQPFIHAYGREEIALRCSSQRTPLSLAVMSAQAGAQSLTRATALRAQLEVIPKSSMPKELDQFDPAVSGGISIGHALAGEKPIPLELIAEIYLAHLPLLTSNLGKKASRNRGAIHWLPIRGYINIVLK